MKRQLSYSICLLVIAGLAFISRDGWRSEAASCPNHELAARFTEEHRWHGVIDTAKYPTLKAPLVEALIHSNSGVCLVSESASDTLPSRPAFLYRDQAGRYYLVFDGGSGGKDRVGFGPIPE